MSEQSLTKKDIEELLGEQTDAILTAVDDKLGKFEFRFNDKSDRLMTTPDRFPKRKRLTDAEDGFTRAPESPRCKAGDEWPKPEGLSVRGSAPRNTVFQEAAAGRPRSFTIVKKDVNQIKEVIKEKLGVNLF